MKTEEGLFEKLYAVGKEALDAMKKPIVKNRVKRRLHSAFDDAESQIIEAEGEIMKLREDFNDYKVNRLLELKQTIAKAREIQSLIEAEYKELFAEEMKA